MPAINAVKIHIQDAEGPNVDNGHECALPVMVLLSEYMVSQGLHSVGLIISHRDTQAMIAHWATSSEMMSCFLEAAINNP